MRLSKFQKAKLVTATSTEKASVRKSVKVLLDAGFLSAKRSMFIHRHYK